MTATKSNRLIVLLSYVAMVAVNSWTCNPNQVDFLSAISKLSTTEYGGYDVTGPFSFDYAGNVNSSSGNPSTRYGSYRLNPPSTSAIINMPGNAAIIFYMCTPPNLSYYSFSATIEFVIQNNFQKAYVIESPLGPIVNQYNFNTVSNINENDGNINIMTSLVHTADQQTWMDIAAAFQETSSDLSSSLTLDAWRNEYNGKTLPFDRTGQYLVVARTVGFDNEAEESDWYSTVQNTVYLIQKQSAVPVNPRIPFENIQMPPKTSTINEIILYGDEYDTFIDSIIDFYVESSASQETDIEYDNELYFLEASAFYGDAYIDCISNNKYCYGYHSDVVYWMQVSDQSLVEEPINLGPNFVEDFLNIIATSDYEYLLRFNTKSDFFVFGGIDSTLEPASATYMNLAIKTPQKLIASIDSSQFTGNGGYISSAFSRFFAAVVVINENYQPCIENIPCINIDVQVNDSFAFVFRHYLNPQTETGPDKDQLLQPFVLHFKASTSADTVDSSDSVESPDFESASGENAMFIANQKEESEGSLPNNNYTVQFKIDSSTQIYFYVFLIILDAFCVISGIVCWFNKQEEKVLSQD